MFLSGLVVLLISCAVAIEMHINNRGPQKLVLNPVPSPLEAQWRSFNNMTTQNGVSVWRYSSYNYCPTTFLPLTKQPHFTRECMSVLYAKWPEGRAFQIDCEKVLYNGHFEDPRAIDLDAHNILILFTHLTKGPNVMNLIQVNHTGVLVKHWTFRSSKVQKNWVPLEVKNNSLKIMTRVPSSTNASEIIHVDLRWPKTIDVETAFNDLDWRGSSNYVDFGRHKLGFVHKRLNKTIEKRFMPDYVYALQVLDHNYTLVSQSGPLHVDVPAFPGFTFITGLRGLNETTFEVSLGVSDCYALRAYLDRDDITKALAGQTRTLALYDAVHI